MKQRQKKYTERWKLRVTLSVTEPARERRLVAAALPEGRDSAAATASNTSATACLKVAAAVLNKNSI